MQHPSPALPAKIGRVYLPGAPSPSLLSTPEQFWPFTPQLGSLTLDQSAALGAQHLNTAILSQLALGHSVNVWGTSQGSLVVTDDIRWLMAHGSPGASQVKFVLTGDPGNPDGGTTHCPRPESSNNPLLGEFCQERAQLLQFIVA